METIYGILIYSFMLGSLYLLMSLGFSLICGVLRIFNLAYGVTFLVAVYGMWMLMHTFGIGLIPAIVGVFLLQFLFTLGIIYFPIVRRYMEKEELLLTSLLLVSLIAEEFINYVYPLTAGVDIPTMIIPDTFKISGLTLPFQMLFVIASAVIVTAFFIVFLLKTRTGLKIRAVSQNNDGARVMGVNIQWIYVLAMILAVIPPTVCMIIIAPIWSIKPTMGEAMLQTGILVTILGGLGNLRGTIIASLIVGFISSAIAFLVNPRLVNMAILIVVFLVLTLKPEGIAKSESLW
jgi:branched-chain amino acid transport system permease protein